MRGVDHPEVLQVVQSHPHGTRGTGSAGELAFEAVGLPAVHDEQVELGAAAIAVPSTTGGRNMTGDDFALTAGWGHFGTADAVMPGKSRIVEPEYTQEELDALGEAISTLGAKTLDVYLNDRAF